MEFVNQIWNMISMAGQAAGIIIFAFGAIKTIIGVLEHQSNQITNNIFLMVGGAITIAIFTLIKGVNLSFGYIMPFTYFAPMIAAFLG